jgi:hypothetical protein
VSQDLRVEQPVEAQLADELMGIIARMPAQQKVLIRTLAWVAEMLSDLAIGAIEVVPEPVAPSPLEGTVVPVTYTDGEGTVVEGLATIVEVRPPVETPKRKRAKKMVTVVEEGDVVFLDEVFE